MKQVLRSQKSVLALFLLSGALLQGCLGDDSGPSGSRSQDEARLRITTTLPRTQSLSKGNLIALSRLVVTLTSNATPADTLRDTLTTSTTPALSSSSTSDQTLSKTYTLKGLRTWSVSARVYDSRDSLIHEGSAASAAFLKVGDSASVSLSLVPRFAMYEARFVSIPDSVTSLTGPNKQVLRLNRLVLRVNGVTVRDSTSPGPWFAALTDHVLAYDYVPVSANATEPGVPPLGQVDDLYAVDFPKGGDTGIMVGSPYNYRSIDGGLTWFQHVDNFGHPAVEFKYVSYFSGSRGLMGGDSTYRIVENAGGIQPAVRQGVASNTTAAPVAMGSADTGYALQNSTSVTGASTFRRTTDGGASWNITASYMPNYYGMHCVSATECWAVGYRGAIRKNVNGSGGFTTLQRDTASSRPDLRDVFFLTSTHGWAVGNSGTILATTNGGTNWNAQASGTSQRLNSVRFLDLSNGYAVGENGTLLATVDGGATWSARASGTGNHLRGLSFSGGTGWIVGTNGTVLRLGGVQNVELLIYGTMNGWNPANPLFRGTRYIMPLPGVDATSNLTLNWSGPNTGVEKVTVTIGRIGKTQVVGTPIGGIPKRSRN